MFLANICSPIVSSTIAVGCQYLSLPGLMHCVSHIAMWYLLLCQ